MSTEETVSTICDQYAGDRSRLMDVVLAVQEELGHVPGEAMDAIARSVGCQRAEVESLVSFYAFITQEPKGDVVVRVCNDVVDRMFGADAVLQTFSEVLGIQPGQTTDDGKITLETTPCIGMSDQAPAALINDVVVTSLSPSRARELAQQLRQTPDPKQLSQTLGDGNNAAELIESMVRNNVRLSGPVVLGEFRSGTALKKALSMTPQEVIRDTKTARIRGRGGAGFPVGMKWEFTRAASGFPKYVLCNADEGEPGTFKDRVILTERAHLLLEGMTIAGYAIGSQQGILYLRAEYAYLRPWLEHALDERRQAGLLGSSICGKAEFSFDIRIQMGAGSYVCGEETALISSCEGLRGDPKNRPPFPAQHGYLGCPTVVNNVETFCCVTRVLEHGAGWFAQFGTKVSPGTKLLSISGDCKRPGVYEVEFGTPLQEVLTLCGGENAAAVQIGGPSGSLLGPQDWSRKICFDDLATGGSLMVFGPQRDVLDIVSQFLEFFCDESCGYCTPCRVGTTLMKEGIDLVRSGQAGQADIEELEKLAGTVKMASRCGLGQTAPNPVLSSLERFQDRYLARLTDGSSSYASGFQLAKAVAQAETLAGHASTHSSNGDEQ